MSNFASKNKQKTVSRLPPFPRHFGRPVCDTVNMRTPSLRTLVVAFLAACFPIKLAAAARSSSQTRLLQRNAHAFLIRDRDAATRNRVIAMSLYGANKDYAYGAVENALLVRRDWTGWTLRIYHDDQVDASMLTVLRSLGVHLVLRRLGQGLAVTEDARGSAGHRAMFWRFDVAADASVTRYIIRDTDALLSRRDRLAVQDWIDSGRYVHVMRDHPHHVQPIMGGMWGAVGGLVPASVFDVGSAQDRGYNEDQLLLHAKVWPWARKLALVHDAYSCTQAALAGAEWRPYPVERISQRDFVGNKYEADTNYQGLQVGAECPVACRGNASWAYC